MADLSHRLPQNIPGIYYVDDTCIDCDMCRSIAPALFARLDDTGSSYVYRQPITPEEFALAEEARLACPTETIGNDGSSRSAHSEYFSSPNSDSAVASATKNETP